MNLLEWLRYGIEHGFCSDVVCATHDGLPLTQEEEDQWEDGIDACVFGVRVNEGDSHAELLQFPSVRYGHDVTT